MILDKYMTNKKESPVEEGWLRDIGGIACVLGSITLVSSILVLPFGLTAAGTAATIGVGTGLAGIAAIKLNEKIDGIKLKKLFKSAPPLIKYITDFAKKYVAKHKTIRLTEPTDCGIDETKGNNPGTGSKQYYAECDLEGITIRAVCDEEVKTIKSIYVKTYRVMEKDRRSGVKEKHYTEEYVLVPEPPKDMVVDFIKKKSKK